MNPQTPPHAAELSIHQTLKRVEDCVRREPTKAVAVALGTGLVLKPAALTRAGQSDGEHRDPAAATGSPRTGRAEGL